MLVKSFVVWSSFHLNEFRLPPGLKTCWSRVGSMFLTKDSSPVPSPSFFSDEPCQGFFLIIDALVIAAPNFPVALLKVLQKVLQDDGLKLASFVHSFQNSVNSRQFVALHLIKPISLVLIRADGNRLRNVCFRLQCQQLFGHIKHGRTELVLAAFLLECLMVSFFDKKSKGS